MHIVCLTHLFHPARGGTEAALGELGRQWVRRGRQVTVVTSNQIRLEDFRRPRENPDLPPEAEVDGIRIIRLRLSRLQRTLLARLGAVCLRSRSARGANLWYLSHVPHLPGMIRRAVELKPDILYAVPFPTAPLYYAWQAALKTGCPWVIQPHLHEAQMNESLLTVMDWLFPQAAGILTNTQPEKDFLTARGLDAGKIRVLGQGLPEESRMPGDGPAFRRRHGLGENALVVFLGRKVAGKGLETLLAAMGPVWAESPETVLLLAGQGSPYFRDLMERHPAARDQRVRSLDDFPEEEKRDLLAAADLLALPSSIESFGVVFLEAWAQQKPVIGVDIPAVAAMITPEKDGLLVPDAAAPALAAAILRLLQDPELRRNMGEAGAAKVRERFDSARVAAAMDGFFMELIEKNR